MRVRIEKLCFCSRKSQPFSILRSDSSLIIYEKGDWPVDKSLSHTKWNCKYHIIFIPKYRRKVIYGKYRREIGKILRQLCEYKGVEIVEGNACIDHIHMLVKIPPKYSVSNVMGYLKGKSALMVFDRFANLKYKFGNRHFWSRGYYVSTVGLNEATIKKYIREQETADKMIDKVSVKELEDPFRGS
jgi:putative transposase